MAIVVKTLEKVYIPMAVAPVEFPPQIFAGFDSILVSRYFCSALFKEALGHLYIGVFMSDKVCG
jgi:hypothetical protein